MKTYRITIRAWGKKVTQTITTATLANAIAIVRQEQYRGMCTGDLLTDIHEGRVPVLKCEAEVIDEMADTLQYVFKAVKY